MDDQLNKATLEYHAYGLSLRVCLAGLEGRSVQSFSNSLLADKSSGVVDDPCEEKQWYCSPYLDEHGKPILSISNQGGRLFHFQYSDGCQFLVDSRSGHVWAWWPSQFDWSYAEPYLYGPVLGYVLRLRGVCSLHASAIAVGGEAVAFCGVSGAGKSTIAAAFCRLGYPILSDDIAALRRRNGDYLVSPGHPQLCLWPDSVETLFGCSDVLPKISEGWEKRGLQLGRSEAVIGERAIPLRAVYLIGARDSMDTPRIDAVEPREALMSIVSNTYGNMLPDSRMHAKDLVVAGELVRSGLVRRVVSHTDPTRIYDMCRAVLEDFHVHHAVKD